MSARRALFAALLLVALLAPAGAAEAARTYRFNGADIYVRNKPSGYALGTMYAGQTIDIQRRAAKNWAYGLVHGEFGRWRGHACGWVRLASKQLFTRTGKAKNGCPRRGNLIRESSIFKRRSYIAHAGTGAVRPVNVRACPDSRAFGNYDPRTRAFSHPYAGIPTGQGPEVPGFGLRYVTKDGVAAMVKNTPLANAPPWMFMPAHCIERLPVYIGDDPRTEGNPGGGGFTVLFGDAIRSPSLLNAFKDAIVLNARWRLFGTLNPKATGTARVNSCSPICASGKIYRRRGARITLSDARVGDCRGKRAFLYTHASITWPKIKGQPNLGTTQHGLSTHCAGYGRQVFCDELKLSFTNADVTAKLVRCSTAMSVARRVIRQRKKPGHGFKCKRHFNKQFAINSLRCSRGKARIEADWGD